MTDRQTKADEIKTELEYLRVGGEIVFNDRVQGLRVVRRYEGTWTRVYVEGPRGGNYRLTAGGDGATVARDACEWDHSTEWVKVDELESVEQITEPEEVEPPAEVGDELKEETVLDCVSYTGEFWGYEVVEVDRDSQEITYETVAYPESADPDEWTDSRTVGYLEWEDKVEISDLELVESLAEDDDVTLEDAEDDDEPDRDDDEPELVPDGGRPMSERYEPSEGDRVVVRTHGPRARSKRTGEIMEVDEERISRTRYVVDLDGSGHAWVSRDALLPVEEVDL